MDPRSVATLSQTSSQQQPGPSAALEARGGRSVAGRERALRDAGAWRPRVRKRRAEGELITPTVPATNSRRSRAIVLLPGAVR